MQILSCTPRDSAFSKIQCRICKKEMNIQDYIRYTVTQSGVFVCEDCLDRLVRENLRKDSNYEF